MLAALILYIPANTYPFLTVIRFGAGQPSTILQGVRELMVIGEWPLALLVFFASVTVPVLKLVGLILLLTTTMAGLRTRRRDRTVLYRVLDAVGRWSMIDIFMESILVALVQFGAVVTDRPWTWRHSLRRGSHPDHARRPHLRSQADLGSRRRVPCTG